MQQGASSVDEQAGGMQLPMAEGEVSSVSLGLSEFTQTENSGDDITPGVWQLIAACS